MLTGKSVKCMLLDPGTGWGTVFAFLRHGGCTLKPVRTSDCIFATQIYSLVSNSISNKIKWPHKCEAILFGSGDWIIASPSALHIIRPFCRPCRRGDYRTTAYADYGSNFSFAENKKKRALMDSSFLGSAYRS
jgi:hypothetical protein